jgi:hypothetical protein
MRLDLNKIEPNTLNPKACQMFIVDQPNMSGISQFHNNITGKANITLSNSIIPTPIKTAVMTVATLDFLLYISPPPLRQSKT